MHTLPSFDPVEPIRRRFAKELARQKQRLVDSSLSVPRAIVDQARDRTAQFLTDPLQLIGRLSHAAVDAYLEASRGPFARLLSSARRCCAANFVERASMASDRLLTLLPTLLLLGCVQRADVAVDRAGGAITMSVARSGAEPPCVQSVSVSQADADNAETPPIWETSTAEPGRCRYSFVYGQVPSGYAQSGAAPSLLVGSRYLVEVAGPGLLGGREFTVRAEDGPMTDAARR